RAHVLVNLANRDPSQVPGKCFEYMGAGRPVLHIGDAPGDAVAAEVRSRQRGWVCAPSEAAIAAKLRRLQQLHAGGGLHMGLRLDREGVAEFGWSHLAKRLDALLREVAAKPAGWARGARWSPASDSIRASSRDSWPMSATRTRIRRRMRPPRALRPRTLSLPKLSLWMSSTCASSCAIRLV